MASAAECLFLIAVDPTVSDKSIQRAETSVPHRSGSDQQKRPEQVRSLLRIFDIFCLYLFKDLPFPI